MCVFINTLLYGKVGRERAAKVIVSRLLGGLGNQLFQYAAGRALSLRLNVPYKIDISDFENYKLRNYDLSNFNVQAGVATGNDRPAVAQGFLARLFISSSRRIRRYREKSFSFDAGFERLPDNTYLDGYWQSEKYFKAYEEQLRDDFGIIKEPLENNRRLIDSIRGVQAVSVHVRRGDYVTNNKTNAFHGTCTVEYYKNAVSYIRNRLDAEVVCYVFSDDIQWARENLQLGAETVFVDGNGDAFAYEDMRLMSACGHHVIANSTFSWWGAWLNPSPEKIVVAPAQWFSKQSVDTSDLIPERWVRL